MKKNYLDNNLVKLSRVEPRKKLEKNRVDIENKESGRGPSRHQE